MMMKMTSKNISNRLKDTILGVLLKIAKKGEGALIVLGECKYKPLVKQVVPSFNVIENTKLLENLAKMDGAVVINHSGYMEAYGVQLESKFTWKNFGTRHSAGYSNSMKEGNIVYVLSEEENKIKIFQKGRLIMEINALEKGIDKKIPEINKIMQSVGWGTTASFFGSSLLVQGFGVSVISGITIFVTIFGFTYLPQKFKEWGWIK